MTDAQARLHSLHDEIDRETAGLAARHRARLHCGRGCNACCVDGLTVFEVEAERIRRAHPELLREGAPHPPGACAFLGDAGECRVYAERPYVCRTQGLPLRWIEEDERGERVERRDICPLNEQGEPLEALPERACWTLGPYEERLRGIQEAADGGTGRRVALRALFERP
jgi:Fe-S-cluster containining protein